MKTSTDLPASSSPTLHDLMQKHSFDELKASTTETVRKQPANARERWLLVQLLCLDGEWERALKQLQTWATLTPDGEPRAQLHRGLIQSEMFRAEVFAGLRTPGSIDPLPAWVNILLQANAKLGEGKLAEADALREAALNDAPATRGESEQMGAFEWLSESDTRLGPVCEMAVAGGYRWIPFNEMKSLILTPAATLTDLVWRPITAILRNATVLRGYLPTRYPDSEIASADIKLARKTEWTNVGKTGVIALGQKTWTTDQNDFGLLEIGECRFTHESDDAA
jgi:type VI secretion system protein ImpE